MRRGSTAFTLACTFSKLVGQTVPPWGGSHHLIMTMNLAPPPPEVSPRRRKDKLQIILMVVSPHLIPQSRFHMKQGHDIDTSLLTSHLMSFWPRPGKWKVDFWWLYSVAASREQVASAVSLTSSSGVLFFHSIKTGCATRTSAYVDARCYHMFKSINCQV